MGTKKAKEGSFESQLRELEELTRKLESGELTLEQSLEAYEKGVAVSRRLLAQLDAAEKRIEILNAATGELSQGAEEAGGTGGDTENQGSDRS